MEVRPGQGLLTLTMAGALLLTGCSGGESAGDRLQAVQAAYGRLKQFPPRRRSPPTMGSGCTATMWPLRAAWTPAP